MADGPLAGRVSVVTGASRGLGAAVAKRLAAAGSHVVLIARTVGGLEETDDAIRAAGGSATLVPLDLAELDTVLSLGPSLHGRFGRVDALVALAAELGPLSPVPHGDLKAWQRVLDVTLTANQRLLTTLHPLLTASPAGRVVMATCRQADGRQPFWYAYAAAKAGLETLVRLYAAEMAKSAVCANLVDPGPMRTRLRRLAFPGEDAAALPDPDSRADAVAALAGPETLTNGELVRLG